MDEAAKSPWVTVYLLPIPSSLWIPSGDLQTSCPATFPCLSYNYWFQGDKVKIRFEWGKKSRYRKCLSLHVRVATFFGKNPCINTCTSDGSVAGGEIYQAEIYPNRQYTCISIYMLGGVCGFWKRIPCKYQGPI